MPHQWIKGNTPQGSKCAVCEKACGSAKKLQDYRCLWCHETVHTNCKNSFPIICSPQRYRLSLLPPTAISLSVNKDGENEWKVTKPPGTCPLIVFINTKSGGNQGIKVLRRFKRILNPSQVFDLAKGGPTPGLMLFKALETFRVLICGGDGTVGWVLSEMDKLNIKVQVAVLPIGTGNDLARVLGWGASLDDDQDLPELLDEYERSHVTMLDRWSIQVKKRRSRKSFNRKRSSGRKKKDQTLEIGGASGVVSNFDQEAAANASSGSIVLKNDKDYSSPSPSSSPKLTKRPSALQLFDNAAPTSSASTSATTSTSTSTFGKDKGKKKKKQAEDDDDDNSDGGGGDDDNDGDDDDDDKYQGSDPVSMDVVASMVKDGSVAFHGKVASNIGASSASALSESASDNEGEFSMILFDFILILVF